LKELYAKVTKDTKSPIVGVKLLNASMRTFIAAKLLSYRHLFGTLYADQQLGVLVVLWKLQLLKR
jgi:hypothetical protein